MTIYLIKPNSSPREIIDEFDEGSRHVEIAKELAGLIGEDERATQIGNTWTRAHTRESV